MPNCQSPNKFTPIPKQSTITLMCEKRDWRVRKVFREFVLGNEVNLEVVLSWYGRKYHYIRKTPMVPIHQNLNAARYLNIIFQPVAISHITRNRRMVLMHDNATPHTARTTHSGLVAQTLTVLNMNGTRSTGE